MSGRMSDEDRREVRALHAKVDRDNRVFWAWHVVAWVFAVGFCVLVATYSFVFAALALVGVLVATHKTKAILDGITRDLNRARALLIASGEMTR